MTLHLEADRPAVHARELAQLFADALGASPEGVVIHDATGRILACNPAAGDILGLTISEICGRTSMDPRWRAIRVDGTPFLGDDHPSSVTLRTGEPVKDTVMGVRRPDGALRWIRITSWPLPVGAGRGAVAFFSDVTDARRLEQELAIAQDRLAMAAEAGGVGLWEWDLRTGRIWCDDGFAKIVGGGTAPTEPSLERFLARVHSEDRHRATADMQHIARGHPPRDASYRIVLDDGAVRHLLAQGRVVERDGGRPVLLAGVVIDVTDSTAAAEAVVRHLEAMTDAYLAVDEDWRFTYLNTRAEQLLGRRREDLLGRIVWDEFPDALGTTFERAYRQALASGEAVAFTEHYPPLDAWFDVTATPSAAGLSIYFRDASERRRVEAERERLLARERQARADAERSREAIFHAATHDDLTGLANRAALRAFLDSALADPEGHPPAVLLLDADRFKLINDVAGHLEGDRALQEIAGRLRSLVRDEDMLARLGGDEFVIATARPSEEALALADSIIESFQRPVIVDDKPYVVTMSVGLSAAGAGATAENLLRDADTALYRAKDDGRNRIRVFDDDLRRRVVRRLGVEQRLRTALDAGAVDAAYQPIFSLRTGKAEAAEALCRWVDPDLGAVSPSEFIPVAEETGLIVALGRAMRERAVTDRVDLLDATGPGGVVWVNASTLELELPCVAAQVIEAAHALPGLVLGIEVTESALRDDDTVLGLLRQLSGAGVRIAIDDFGTGYSSIGRLDTYPIDLLKIDRSFVAALADEASRSLVAAMVQMARAVGARTCAEGVETVDQLHAVRSLGVDSASGYLLARPSPIEDLGTATRSGVLTLASATGR